MKTLEDDFTIEDDFPAVGYDQWRAIVEESLGGAPFERKLVTHTYEGIDIQSLYSRKDELGDGDPLGFPGLPPFVRGSLPLGAARTGWDLRPEYSHPDIATTNEAILDDLAGGATSLVLQLDSAASQGLDPDEPAAAGLAGHDGIMAYGVDDFDAVLKDARPELIGVTLDSGGAFLPAAASLVGLWQRREVPLEKARGAFNADPLAALARNGQLPVTPRKALTQLAELARWTADRLPCVTAVAVDTSPYHDAGATAAQDIAFAMATGVEYLRAMNLPIDQSARQVLFRMGLGTHHFLAIAKLRAARILWGRVVAASGGSAEAGAMRVHARTSDRVLTRRDPYVNLLRNTVAIFAAGVGGADAITSVPFDAISGQPDTFSRRIARNSVLVLQDEAHLHRVVDPAGGSWYLDQLTQQLSEKAWETFQEIERQGGMLAALQSGWVANQIDSAFAPRAKDIAKRKRGITGISEFPNVNEQREVRPAPDIEGLRSAASTRLASGRSDNVDLSQLTATESMDAAVNAAAKGATIGQMARALGFHAGPTDTISPLEPRNFAEPFEALRDASDAWQAKHGQRPSVFLANMGPIAHHTARAAYSRNFFEAGGFEVIGNDGFEDAKQAVNAFTESGARIAVICSSDKLYPEMVPEVAAKLKSAGARSVVLAGNPGGSAEEWQAAGVDRFIFVKCDVLDTLRQLLVEEGVLEGDGE